MTPSAHRVIAAVGILDGPERVIVSSYYGLSGRPMSHGTMAKRFGISVGAIRARHQSALRRMCLHLGMI